MSHEPVLIESERIDGHLPRLKPPRLGSNPLLREPRASWAVFIDGWRPIETLVTPYVEVALIVPGEREAPPRLVKGWLATHLRCAPRTFWTLVDGRARNVSPTLWHPIEGTEQERVAA